MRHLRTIFFESFDVCEVISRIPFLREKAEFASRRTNWLAREVRHRIIICPRPPFYFIAKDSADRRGQK